jgi:hypothetical protein
MLDRIERELTPARRKYVYRVVTALLGMGVIYGLVSGEEAAGWGVVLMAVTGMADRNTEVPAKE